MVEGNNFIMIEIVNFINFSWIISFFLFIPFAPSVVIILIFPEKAAFDIFSLVYLLFQFIEMVIIVLNINQIKKIKKMIEDKEFEKINEKLEEIILKSKVFFGSSFLLILSLLSNNEIYLIGAFYITVTITVIQILLNYFIVAKLRNWLQDIKINKFNKKF